MNWNSNCTTEVNKEKIWRELVLKEQREVKIFDSFRATINKASGIATPISERQTRFLDKTQVLFDASMQVALPELKRSASSQSRYNLPLHNMEQRVMASTCASSAPALTSSFGPQTTTVSSTSMKRPPTSCPSLSRSRDDVCRLSSSLSNERLNTVVSRGVSSASVTRRPTSAAEYGSNVVPLVRHTYRYSIPKNDDITPVRIAIK